MPLQLRSPTKCFHWFWITTPIYPILAKSCILINISFMIPPPLQKYSPKGLLFHHIGDLKTFKNLLSRPCKINDSSSDKRGCFKCKGKCDLFRNFLVESDHFTSASSNRSYSITQHLHCKSKNVKCNVQYVGSTSNKFKVRFRNHGLCVHFHLQRYLCSSFGIVDDRRFPGGLSSYGQLM